MKRAFIQFWLCVRVCVYLLRSFLVGQLKTITSKQKVVCLFLCLCVIFIYFLLALFCVLLLLSFHKISILCHMHILGNVNLANSVWRTALYRLIFAKKHTASLSIWSYKSKESIGWHKKKPAKWATIVFCLQKTHLKPKQSTPYSRHIQCSFKVVLFLKLKKRRIHTYTRLLTKLEFNQKYFVCK